MKLKIAGIGLSELSLSEGERDVASEFADDSLRAAVRALVEHGVLHCYVGLLEATHLQSPLQCIGVGQRVQRTISQSPGVCCQIINAVLLVHLQLHRKRVCGHTNGMRDKPYRGVSISNSNMSA